MVLYFYQNKETSSLQSSSLFPPKFDVDKTTN